MKKIFVITAVVLSVCSLGAVDMTNVSVNGNVKFQTETVNRGRKEGTKAFVPSAEIGIKAFEQGQIYVGTKAILNLEGKPANRWNDVVPYVGLTYNAMDALTIDLGYKHHFYTGITSPMVDCDKNTNEMYFGVMYDAMINPSIYAFYDFDREEIALEANVSYMFDLSERLMNGLGVEIGANLGYDRTRRTLGHDYNEIMGAKDYIYYGLNADVVLSLNDNVSARAGVSYAGNDAKKESWTNLMIRSTSVPHKNMMWFSTSIDCKF